MCLLVPANYLAQGLELVNCTHKGKKIFVKFIFQVTLYFG